MILRDRLKFVLVAPSHPGNIGSAARAIKVMGFHRLAVVCPREADPGQHPEALAFASRATDILANLEVYSSLDEALSASQLNIAVSAECREFGPQVMSPEALAERLAREFGGAPSTGQSIEPPKVISLIFGTERTGLSIETVQRCQWMCAIPTEGEYSSLNLSQAVQVLAYVLGRDQQLLKLPEPVRQSQGAGQAQTSESWASDVSLESMFAHLERTLVGIEFLDPKQPKKLLPRLRRIFARSGLTNKEVDILRGVLAQMDKVRKLAKGDPPGSSGRVFDSR